MRETPRDDARHLPAARAVSADLFPLLAQRVFNTPLALHADQGAVVMAALADRLGIGRMLDAPRAIIFPDQVAASLPGSVAGPSARRPGYEVVQGVAIVPVIGSLVAKLATVRPYCGMTGYDGIRTNLLAALTDSQVRAVMLDVDSAGGEVAGCFDLTDTIHAARAIKPIWAVLNENAFSAAYALASAASRVIVPRTGGTGSIGVIVMHADLSRALERDGITVTLIRYGARKSEAASTEPLSPDARARIQSAVDATGELFVKTIARNRGLTQKVVRATEAATFIGAQSVAAGLADAVMAPDAAFRVLLEMLSS